MEELRNSFIEVGVLRGDGLFPRPGRVLSSKKMRFSCENFSGFMFRIYDWLTIFLEFSAEPKTFTYWNATCES